MITLYWQARTFLVWGLVIASVIFFAIKNPAFIDPANLFTITQGFAILALVSTGLAVKVGNTSLVMGIAVGVLVGLGFGLLNGFITAAFRVPSLAVTVGTLVLATGLGFYVSGGNVVTMDDASAGLFLDKQVLPLFSIKGLFCVIVVVLVGMWMRYSKAGVRIYAVGSDSARAATLGINVKRVLIGAFAIAGLLFGLAGVIQGVTLASGTPGSNEALLLQAATAAIVGGVALNGGRGTILGVAGGALLLAVLSSGMSLLGATTFVIQLANGLLLLLVVLIDVPITRALTRRMEKEVRPAAVAAL